MHACVAQTARDGLANFSARLATVPYLSLFIWAYKIRYYTLAGREQSAANQPENLAENPPLLQPLF